jgi:Tol biopolymer transport system component
MMMVFARSVVVAALMLLTLTVASGAPARADAPDRGPILYSKQVGTSWDLFVSRLDGDRTRLTSGDRAEWMGVWTPDRRGIVFIAPRYGLFGTDLFRMRADGSGTRRLAHLKLAIVPDISLSPHGRRLAFSAYPPTTSGYMPTEIYTYGLASGRLRRLTHDLVEDGDPEWSPDGTTLAFDRSGVLWTMAPDGSHRQRLGVEPVTGFEPAWSPNGNRLAFSRSGDLFILRIESSETGRLTRTVDDESSPVWSRDGTRLAYVRSHYDQVLEEWFPRIFVMRADGSAPERISRAGAAHPDW